MPAGVELRILDRTGMRFSTVIFYVLFLFLSAAKPQILNWYNLTNFIMTKLLFMLLDNVT